MLRPTGEVGRRRVMTQIPVCLAALISRFREDDRGSIAVIFAVAIVPILLGVGAAIDFSRANSFRNTTQAALDTALLGGAKDGSASWAQIASNIFNSNAQNNYSNTISSSFSQPASSTYT